MPIPFSEPRAGAGNHVFSTPIGKFLQPAVNDKLAAKA